MTTCRRLIIFEGPDGSGKTTLARDYAAAIGARYVHFSNMLGLNRGLARVYVEGMLPALLGYQDVVFDRSWLSEVPYGKAFRGGADRLGDVTRRMLERLALKCGAVVVMCRPPFDVCAGTFTNRPEVEYLKSVEQLRSVYDSYGSEPTDLPICYWDYTTTLDLKPSFVMEKLHSAMRYICVDPHPLHTMSAGNWDAPVILVGERFANHREQDPFYQWPFASFNYDGCSQWLTKQLLDAGIGEESLLWFNADQPIPSFSCQRTVIALGNAADEMLTSRGVKHLHTTHPSNHKRFHSSEVAYPLIGMIKEALRVP